MTTPTGILFTDPQVKPLSVSGQFQAGCYLYFYGTGTLDQTDVYADGYLQTPLMQPVTADGAGRFVPIYLDPLAGDYGAYRVQLYNAAGALLEDTDPYVPIPTPSAITTLQSDVSDMQGEITALQSAYSSLLNSAQWGALQNVPAPVVALAASTPPNTGATFWNDQGKWASPNLTGTSSTLAVGGDGVVLSSAFQEVIAHFPVTPGATYAMTAQLLLSGGSGGLYTVMTSDQSADTAPTTPLTTGGGAITEFVEAGSAQASFARAGNGTDNGNAAVPGLYNQNVFSGYGSPIAMIARGTFVVDDATTSISFQMKSASGTPTVASTSFATITQIIPPPA